MKYDRCGFRRTTRRASREEGGGWRGATTPPREAGAARRESSGRRPPAATARRDYWPRARWRWRTAGRSRCSSLTVRILYTATLQKRHPLSDTCVDRAMARARSVPRGQQCRRRGVGGRRRLRHDRAAARRAHVRRHHNLAQRCAPGELVPRASCLVPRGSRLFRCGVA